MTCLQKRISHEEAQICVRRVCRLVSESELTGFIFMELMGGGPKPYKATNYIISNKLHKMISFQVYKNIPGYIRPEMACNNMNKIGTACPK